MPKRSSKRKRHRDLNSLAAAIVADATAEPVPEIEPAENQGIADDDGKNPAAVALGRLGGKVGGRARARKLSKKRRSEIAKKAAMARWKKK